MRRCGRPHRTWEASTRPTQAGGRTGRCRGPSPSTSSFDELARDRFLVGTPEECAADLERYRSLGVDTALVRMIWPGMDLEAGLRSMDLFAGRVMPSFR